MNSPTPTTWRRVKLGDSLAALIDHRGITPKKLGGDWALSGIPAISAKNVKDGAIVNQADIRYVDADLYQRWMPEKLESGDILMTSEAPLGELYYLKAKTDYCLSQRIFALRTDQKVLDSRFLYYYLRTKTGRHELNSRATGTTAAGIRRKELVKIDIFCPDDLGAQKEIAGVLAAYDDLIEVNEKKIKALEQVAQAVYREWFVHFRFPGHEKSEFIDSSLGRIPKGWEVKKLGGVVENFDSKRRPVSKMKRAEIRGIYPYYGAAKVIDYVDDYIFDGKYLLLAEDGSVIRDDRTPMLQLVNEKFWPNNHTHILRGGEVSTEYLYLFLRGYDISGHITGVAQPKINQENLNRIELLVAQPIVRKVFDEVAVPIIEQVFLLQKENANLRQTRDLLLPKLMSGEVLAT